MPNDAILHKADPNYEAEKMRRTLQLAQNTALKWGVMGTILGGAGTFYAMKNYPNFDKNMSVSAKTSIPVMCGLFFWGLQYELVMVDCQRHPEKYGLSDEYIEPVKASKLPFHQKAMNYLYDHPLTFVGTMGVPAVGLVLKEQMKHKGLTISQRIMQTRVFGQATVLSILLTTMAFRGWMEKRGKFQEPKE